MRSAAALFVLSLCNPALLVQALQPAAGPHPALIFSVENIGNGAVPINGEWQFHLGDNPHWAAPAYDDPSVRVPIKNAETIRVCISAPGYRPHLFWTLKR